MIVLNLLCSSGHQFEGWFSSADSFDTQVARGLVTCPDCNGKAIERLPTAPRLSLRLSNTKGTENAIGAGAVDVIERLCELAEASEDVGKRFPDEARRIHYQQAEARSIRGQATVGETKELLEEGIHVLPVPTRPRRH